MSAASSQRAAARRPHFSVRRYGPTRSSWKLKIELPGPAGGGSRTCLCSSRRQYAKISSATANSSARARPRRHPRCRAAPQARLAGGYPWSSRFTTPDVAAALRFGSPNGKTEAMPLPNRPLPVHRFVGKGNPVEARGTDNIAWSFRQNVAFQRPSLLTFAPLAWCFSPCDGRLQLRHGKHHRFVLQHHTLIAGRFSLTFRTLQSHRQPRATTRDRRACEYRLGALHYEF